MRHLERIYMGLEGYIYDGHRLTRSGTERVAQAGFGTNPVQPRWVIAVYMATEPAFANGRIVFDAED